MSSKEPWADFWEQGRRLGSGGHGSTFVVRRRGGSDKTEYTLKVLNSPRDPERRDRLRREVAAHRKLAVAGVPRLIDANDEITDPSIPLYLVREYVSGPTLEEVVARGPLSLDTAVQLVRGLLEIVRSCHVSGVCHRDVKPDNVVLKDASAGDPILVDFGLSVVNGDKSLTGSEQQLGNRFLGLPELQTPEADKRSPISDVTQCCGLLLYALTGVQPMTLTDGNGQKPHQRQNAQAALASIDPRKRVALAKVFDRAFEVRVADRWQSAEELLGALRGIENLQEPVAQKAFRGVSSLWTLHMDRGRPSGLYFGHWLREDSELKDFFTGNLPPIPFEDLSDTVQRAAEVLWNEIKTRPEVAPHIPKERPFQHAFDHVNRNLEDELAADGCLKNPVKWNRELARPNGRAAGPVGAPIPVASLTAAGQAAVAELDEAARRSASACLTKTMSEMKKWNERE